MKAFRKLLCGLVAVLLIGTAAVSAEEAKPENTAEINRSDVMNKLSKANKKIEKAVVSGYKTIENGVVSGYKAVEDGVVNGYRKIEKKFVESFLTSDSKPDSRTAD